MIAPSLLSADFTRIAEEIKTVEDAGASYHHLDVMDGHFVPNLTFGPPIIKKIKEISKLPLDVHIMVSNPDQVAEQYVEAGADMLSFHVEAAIHHHSIIEMIKSNNVKAGLAINPGTPLEKLWPLLSSIDFINVMSVNPGFGGQSFINESYVRIKSIVKKIEESGRKILIEVDGGVNQDNAAAIYSAGANILVAGNAIYGEKDRKAALESLAKTRRAVGGVYCS